MEQRHPRYRSRLSRLSGGSAFGNLREKRSLSLIFKHRDVVDFLAAEFAAKRKRNPRFSLRSWCRQIGLKEAASLSLILARKRPVSQRIAEVLKDKVLQSKEEREYFDIIRVATDAKDPETKAFYEKLAADFRPSPARALMRLERFKVISNWYHFVILEMTQLSGFKEDPEWIRQRLGGSVSQREIRSALVRMLEQGYLKRDKGGQLKRSEQYLYTETDEPNAGLRLMHGELIQLAARALNEQSIDHRDITGFNTITSYSRIREAKRMIADFRRHLMAYLEDPNGDTVYQVNIQMFDLLRKTNAGTPD